MRDIYNVQYILFLTIQFFLHLFIFCLGKRTQIHFYLIKIAIFVNRGLLRFHCCWHHLRVKSHHGYVARVAPDGGLDRTDGRKLELTVVELCVDQ